MRKALIAALAAFAGMGATAHAADIYGDGGSLKDEPAVYAVPASWTGIYFGAGIGAGASVTDFTIGDDDYEFLGFDGIGGEGGLGTLQLGYDYQLSNRFVLGAFVDYDFSGIETDLDLNGREGSFEGSLELDHMWTLGARFGFLPSPDTLVYGLVGYSWGTFAADGSYTGYDLPDVAAFVTEAEGPSAVSGNGELDVEGWTLGAGIETRLSDNWSIKGEYRFTQFDDESIAEYVSVEPSVHTGRAVLTYRINPFERSLDSYK